MSDTPKKKRKRPEKTLRDAIKQDLNQRQLECFAQLRQCLRDVRVIQREAREVNDGSVGSKILRGLKSFASEALKIAGPAIATGLKTLL